MRFKQMWMTTMALALAVMPVMAQDRPNAPQPPPGEGAPPPPPPGGRGGQGGGMGGGPMMRSPLSPEKAKAAWKLEAESVGRKLTVDEAKTAKIVEAYSAARESQQKAADELRETMRKKAEEAAGNDADDAGEEGGRGGMRGVMAEIQKAVTELNRTEREKLVTKLAETLDTEQTRKAAASLGTFNNQWDVMADMLAGFNLEADKLNKALAATETYVIAAEQARGFGVDDPESMRTAMQEARANLNDAVKPLLTEEQFGQFQRAGGRGGRGGAGGPAGEGGRGRGGDGAPGEGGQPGAGGGGRGGGGGGGQRGGGGGQVGGGGGR